jgi:TM2 domain-containing membrane protein YozV
MKTAIKAALLSGFMFPGLGQIYLKRYKRGLAILIPVVLGFVIIVGKVIASAMESLEAIQSGGGIADMETISNLARIDSAHSGIKLNVILLLVLCCWLFSVVDAYKIGKRSLPGIDDKKKLPANSDQ